MASPHRNLTCLKYSYYCGQVDKTVAEPGKKQGRNKASFFPLLVIIIIPILIILIPLRRRILLIPDDNSRARYRAAATRSQTAFLGSGSV
jgi:hypothetical protein